MGMFDWVVVESQVYLPDYPQGGVKAGFQTKDIDNLCRRIRITNHGRLFVDSEDSNYHGMFNFYNSFKGEWFEYNAKFTDGDLVIINRVET